MLPRLPENDAGDDRLRAAIPFTDTGLGLPSGERRADSADIVLGELRGGVSFTSMKIGESLRLAATPMPLAASGGSRTVADTSASFASHISGVLGEGAQPEVGRIDTGPVIAGMANDLVGRDGPIGDDPGDSMRANLAGVSAVGSELPVAVTIAASHPIPAGISLVDLGPEAASGSVVKHHRCMVRQTVIDRARHRARIAAGFFRVPLWVSGVPPWPEGDPCIR